MISSKASNLALAVLSYYTVTVQAAGADYIGDRYVDARLGLNSLFALTYVALSVTTILLLINHKYQVSAATYITLFLTALFQAISTIFLIFGVALESGAFMPASAASYGPTNVAFIALVDLFSYWAYALLFLSICMLVRNRHLFVHPNTGPSTTIPILYYSAFALLIVFGIVSTGLDIDYTRTIFIISSSIGLTPAEIIHKVDLWQDVRYTFLSIWYFSSACLLSYVIHVYSESKRSSIIVKTMSFVLRVVIPLYILLNIQSIIFTIINSPSGIHYKVFSKSGYEQMQGVQIASLVISNVLFIATCCAILALGFCEGVWHHDTEAIGVSNPLTRKLSE